MKTTCAGVALVVLVAVGATVPVAPARAEATVVGGSIDADAAGFLGPSVTCAKTLSTGSQRCTVTHTGGGPHGETGSASVDIEAEVVLDNASNFDSFSAKGNALATSNEVPDPDGGPPHTGHADGGGRTELRFTVVEPMEVRLAGTAEVTSDSDSCPFAVAEVRLLGPTPSGFAVCRNGQTPPIDKRLELSPGDYELIVELETVTFGAETATASFEVELGPPLLEGKVTDGHGGPMVGVPVQLLDPGLQPVSDRVVTDSTGEYRIPLEVLPGDYFLSVTLEDAESDPPRFATHFRDGADPVRADRLIGASDFEGPVDFDLTDSDPKVATNTSPGALSDVAVIHRRSKQFVDFLLLTFGMSDAQFGQTTIRTFDLGDQEGARYDPATSPPTIFIGNFLSLFEDRQFPNADGPEGVEWHELTHHYADRVGIADNPACRTAPNSNHGGWDNASSCDSLFEGLGGFIPTFASHVIDGRTDSLYATHGSLEWPWMAWQVSGDIQDEEVAVAAVLWDLADGGLEDFDYRVLPADPNKPAVPVTYVDEIELGFETVLSILHQQKPQTVKELYDILQASTAVPDGAKVVNIDLDDDGFADVSPLDVVFLMHGFHAVEVSNTDFVYRIGTPIGRSDHSFGSGLPVVPRNRTPHQPGADVLLRNDSSQPRAVSITATDGTTDAVWEVPLDPGEEYVQALDLPPHVIRRIEPGDPLPPCGPDNDALLEITISAPGVPPLETDSCQFAHAVAASSGNQALTYAITPPDMTIKGPKNASPLGDDVYSINGSGQTSTTKVKRGKTAIYRLNAQNDTLVSDAFNVSGCRSSRGFKISYFDDGVNVTSQITGVGLSTGTLAPSEFDALELRIKVGRRGPKNKSCLVTATSQNSPSLQDSVLAKVKVKS